MCVHVCKQWTVTMKTLHSVQAWECIVCVCACMHVCQLHSHLASKKSLKRFGSVNSPSTGRGGEYSGILCSEYTHTLEKSSIGGRSGHTHSH